MINSFTSDFADFTAIRINAAEQNLRSDDQYQFACGQHKSDIQKLRDSGLSEIQNEYLDKIIVNEASIATTMERNAYLAGLTDGLRILAAL